MSRRHVVRNAASRRLPLAELLAFDPALREQLATGFGGESNWPAHGRIWRRRDGSIRTVSFSGGHPRGSYVITVRYGG